jgi:hypothetical protein
MVESEFTRAVFVKPGKIAGLRVRPFSLWQSFALEYLNSPVLRNEPLTIGAIVTALDVLRSDSTRGLSRLASAGFWRRAWLSARVGFYGLTRTAIEIDEHINAYSGYPELWRKPDKSPAKRSGAPWQWYVATILMTDYGHTYAQAWDCPTVRAACMKAIRDERTGGDEIVSQEELERYAARKAVANG